MRNSILAACVLLQLAACTNLNRDADNLYTALGEEAGIQAIVDEFLFSLADNRLALPLFANTNIERFREQFAAQLCAVAGGPCEYDGDSMAATHRGMNIDNAQFNSVVEDLIHAMEQREVATGTQNALLARLAPMYGDIIEQ